MAGEFISLPNGFLIVDDSDLVSPNIQITGTDQILDLSVTPFHQASHLKLYRGEAELFIDKDKTELKFNDNGSLLFDTNLISLSYLDVSQKLDINGFLLTKDLIFLKLDENGIELNHTNNYIKLLVDQIDLKFLNSQIILAENDILFKNINGALFNIKDNVIVFEFEPNINVLAINSEGLGYRKNNNRFGIEANLFYTVNNIEKINVTDNASVLSYDSNRKIQFNGSETKLQNNNQQLIFNSNGAQLLNDNNTAITLKPNNINFNVNSSIIDLNSENQEITLSPAPNAGVITVGNEISLENGQTQIIINQNNITFNSSNIIFNSTIIDIPDNFKFGKIQPDKLRLSILPQGVGNPTIFYFADQEKSEVRIKAGTNIALNRKIDLTYGEYIEISSQPLFGPAGPTGPQGAQGAQGLQGLQGNQGAQGLQGIPGPQGPQGVTGPSGGPVGSQGQTGIQGIQGPAGPQGAVGPQGNQGATGPCCMPSEVESPTDISFSVGTPETPQVEITSGSLDVNTDLNVLGTVQAPILELKPPITISPSSRPAGEIQISVQDTADTNRKTYIYYDGQLEHRVDSTPDNDKMSLSAVLAAANSGSTRYDKIAAVKNETTPTPITFLRPVIFESQKDDGSKATIPYDQLTVPADQVQIKNIIFTGGDIEITGNEIRLDNVELNSNTTTTIDGNDGKYIFAPFRVETTIGGDKNGFNNCTFEAELTIDGDKNKYTYCTFESDVIVNGDNITFENCTFEGEITFNGNNVKVEGCEIRQQVLINGKFVDIDKCTFPVGTSGDIQINGDYTFIQNVIFNNTSTNTKITINSNFNQVDNSHLTAPAGTFVNVMGSNNSITNCSTEEGTSAFDKIIIEGENISLEGCVFGGGQGINIQNSTGINISHSKIKPDPNESAIRVEESSKIHISKTDIELDTDSSGEHATGVVCGAGCSEVFIDESKITAEANQPGTTSIIDVQRDAKDINLKDFNFENIDWILRLLGSIQIFDLVKNILIENGKGNGRKGIIQANGAGIPGGPINNIAVQNVQMVLAGAQAQALMNFNWSPNYTAINIPKDDFDQPVKNGDWRFINISVITDSTAPIFSFNPSSASSNGKMENIVIRDVNIIGGSQLLKVEGQVSEITIDNASFNPLPATFGNISENKYAIELIAKDGNLDRISISNIKFFGGKNHLLKLFASSGEINKCLVSSYEFNSNFVGNLTNGHITLESNGAFAIKGINFSNGSITSLATTGTIFGLIGASSANKYALVDILTLEKNINVDVATNTTVYTLGSSIIEL